MANICRRYFSPRCCHYAITRFFRHLIFATLISCLPPAIISAESARVIDVTLFLRHTIFATLFFFRRFSPYDI